METQTDNGPNKFNIPDSGEDNINLTNMLVNLGMTSQLLIK